MENNFLQKLDNYFKENNLTIPVLYFPIERLPIFFRKAIDNYIDKISPNLRMDKFCEFRYDKNGNFILIVSYQSGKTTAVIFSDKRNVIEFENPNYRFTPINLKNVISEASKIEFRYKLINAIKEELSELTDHQKAIYARKITNRMINDYDLTSSIDRSWIENELLEVLPAIEDYASYINEEYIYSQTEEKKEKTIYYESNETLLTPRGKSPKGKGQVERKNEIIPIEDRIETLLNLGPIDQMEAISTNNEDKFFCYLYPMGNDEYRLIAEPLSGEKHTRVFAFVSKDIDKSKILENAIIKYLPLTDDETLSNPYAIRINHTSSDKYKTSVSFIITLDSKLYKTGQYLKDNALTISPDVLTNEDNLSL